MKEVVSAIIVMVTSGVPRVLLTQRRSDKDFPLAWETPGGKVEDGEDHDSALARELVEELGIWPTNMNDAPACEYEVDLGKRGPKMISFYVVFEWAGTVSARERQGLGWFTAEEMRGLELAPANKLALGDVEKYLAAHDEPVHVFGEPA